MIRVGVNGYGTIGKRIADAVSAQPDMEVIGVGKRRLDYVAAGADRAGYPLYIEGETAENEGPYDIDTAGDVTELIERSDVVVDATPAGVGQRNSELYERHGTPAIFQGGERPDVAETSFVADVNFTDAIGSSAVRVVSCNTTGLARLLSPIDQIASIDRVRATLIRRGGDPVQSDRGPINDVVPDPMTVPSHHGPDVNTVLPDLRIDTVGLTVPTTLMHVHTVNVSFEDEVPNLGSIESELAERSRIVRLPGAGGIDGTATIKDMALDAGRPRGDVWENVVFAESMCLRQGEFYCLQAIHQEADVVPENVDAIRAVVGGYRQSESIELTDERLGIGRGAFSDRRSPAYNRQIAG